MNLGNNQIERKMIKSCVFNKNNSFLIYLISTGIITVFLYCGLYAIPSADDYFYANLAKDHGLINAQINHYVEWSGRYAATFLITLFSLTGYEYYWLGPWFCIISLFLSLYYLVKTIFNEIAERIQPLRLALGFSALFLSIATAGYGHGVSVVNEGFFWFSGAITYSGALSLYLLLIALIVKMIKQDNKTFFFLFEIIIIFIVIGLNETAMFLVCITLPPLLFRFKANIGWPKVIALIFTIMVCSSIVFFAPGNDVRMQTSDGGNILSAVGVSLEKLMQIFFYYLLNPFLWLFMLIERRQLKTILSWSTRYISLRWINGLGGFLVFCLYMPVAYSLNSGAPDRLIAFIGFFALIMSIVYAFNLFPWKTELFQKIPTSICYLIFGVSIAGSWFFLEPLRVGLITTYTGHNYYQQHKHRQEYVKSEVSSGRYRVQVDYIERNRLLLFEDLLPKNPNKEYARFYGAQIVKVVGAQSE